MVRLLAPAKWTELRRPLEAAMNLESSAYSIPRLQALARSYATGTVYDGNHVEVYGVFKALAVDMMLSQLFLVESSKGTKVIFLVMFRQQWFRQVRWRILVYSAWVVLE